MHSPIEPWELFLRELVYGALSIIDIALLLVFANLLWKKTTWRKSPSAQIAIALSIFVLGQLMRSGIFWIEYLLHQTTTEFHPALSTIGLSVAPLLVAAGAARLIWAVTAEGWRTKIVATTGMLAVAIPLIVHFLFLT